MVRLLNAAVRFYVVQRGDTLSHIAARVGTNWRALARKNKLKNPHLIFPGQLIQVD
jgi:nucleoid-associated protein YgaU